MAKASSKQQEALQLLDDLDNLSGSVPAPVAATPVEPAPATGHAADVLAFIDEVTQKSSEPTKSAASRITLSRPSSRSSNTPSTLKKKSFEASRAATPLSATSATAPATSSPPASAVPSPNPAARQSPEPSPQPSTSGWGWGAVWSSTTAAIQQARTVVDDQVKTLSANEQARKLQEGVLGYVKTANLDKIGNFLSLFICAQS
jgi:hypothetical protein